MNSNNQNNLMMNQVDFIDLMKKIKDLENMFKQNNNLNNQNLFDDNQNEKSCQLI